jgi:hypothetical protein
MTPETRAKLPSPTFYRHYRELNRIAGISLHKGVTLYKVLPDPNEPPVELKALPPKRRFSLAGVLALLGVFAFFAWVFWECAN